MKLTPVKTLLLLGAGYAIYRASRPAATPVSGYIGDLAGLGADALPLINVTPDISEAKLQNLSDSIKQKLIEAAAAQAAISIAIYIALNNFPVYGQIAAAILAIVQAAGSAYHKRKIQVITDTLRDRINALGTAYTIKYRALRDQVFEEEAVTVRATLAGHNVTPMAGEGLGAGYKGWFGEGTSFNRIAEPVSNFIQQATVIPLKIVSLSSIATVRAVAKVVGAESVVKKMDEGKAQVYELTNKAIDRMTAATLDPSIAISDAGKVLRTITGEEAVFAARDKCNQLYADAAATMEKDYQTFVTNMNNPAFRKALREAMLANPALFSQLDDVTKQLNTASNMKIMLGAGLAAAAGLFMFKK